METISFYELSYSCSNKTFFAEEHIAEALL